MRTLTRLRRCRDSDEVAKHQSPNVDSSDTPVDQKDEHFRPKGQVGDSDAESSGGELATKKFESTSFHGESGAINADDKLGNSDAESSAGEISTKVCAGSSINVQSGAAGLKDNVGDSDGESSGDEFSQQQLDLASISVPKKRGPIRQKKTKPVRARKAQPTHCDPEWDPAFTSLVPAPQFPKPKNQKTMDVVQRAEKLRDIRNHVQERFQKYGTQASSVQDLKRALSAPTLSFDMEAQQDDEDMAAGALHVEMPAGQSARTLFIEGLQQSISRRSFEKLVLEHDDTDGEASGEPANLKQDDKDDASREEPLEMKLNDKEGVASEEPAKFKRLRRGVKRSASEGKADPSNDKDANHGLTRGRDEEKNCKECVP